jgi:hypothetical protein
MMERGQVRSLPKVVKVLGAAAVCVGLAWGGQVAWSAWSNRNVPSCSWPMRVRGPATSAEAGLVRCYLQALAGRSTAGLKAVALNVPPTSVTSADFAFSRAARSGLATAVFRPNPFDDFSMFLTIRYADGTEQNTGLTNEVAMGGGNYWRLDIGQ